MSHANNNAVPGGPSWYSDAAEYWKNVEATVDGMLGGFSNLDDQDAADSIRFVQPLIDQGIIAKGSACDCGAGIGRVTKSFLSHLFSPIDLVEQDHHFINTAKTDPALNSGLVSRFIHCGLQSFNPEEHNISYTGIVWCQWVLGHLTDDDLVAFFNRMVAVCPVIGVKENVASGQYGEAEIDHQDSSMTRAEGAWRRIFKRAGLKVVKEQWQSGWPKGLYRVKSSKEAGVDDDDKTSRA
ncbi:alpha-N-methyltransferase NTM1 [Catenaria anguillulae PL171]|uniref:Alpha N-terminal protein methyltransferase 1 n=1 Tax=Catenaria anguillulae PL171 TaxID=765915 RepID=A0A1Y2H674_9FUNG|nr:alpha-N-methyltransferase NTM1 [Catenaria anguillulae PL171]